MMKLVNVTEGKQELIILWTVQKVPLQLNIKKANSHHCCGC